jgi:DNA-binding transcriptional MerR regulator
MDTALGASEAATDSINLLLLTGDVARILQVSAETVRLYERLGRLHARKTARGIRLFDRRDVERLARERAQQSASEVSGS